MVAAAENYMQIHKAAVGHKDVQNKDLAVHMAAAVHRVMVVHKEMADHTDHSPLEVDHHCTLDLAVWGCPIDLLVLKDFHIGHIGGTEEHHTLKEQEGEVLAFDRSSPFQDSQNLLVEVGPRFFFEVVGPVGASVGAPVAVVAALLQQCRKAGDPWGCAAVTVAACIEKDSEDSEEMDASFFEFEIAGLLVSVCQFEARVGSHSLLKRFWYTGQRTYSGQHYRWEDQVGPCFFQKASLIELQMYRGHLALILALNLFLSAYS